MTLFFVLLLGGVALGFSAFFSGSETGFYKVSRLRLKLDAIEGDKSAAWLLALVNRPTIFVATVLVGNNIANYALSLTVVLLTTLFVGEGSSIAHEVAATFLAAPLLFLYGELLPKQLFLLAPDRLLRTVTPILVVCTLLFLPLSILLWLCNRLLARILGRSHESIKLTLARTELTQTFHVGTLAGVIHPTQRTLAEHVLASSPERVRRWTVLPSTLPRITITMTPAQGVAAISDSRAAAFPVYDSRTPSRPHGYVTRTELLLATEIIPVHACPTIRDNATPLDTLATLDNAPIAAVVDANGVVQGFAFRDVLREELL
ncbi:MAG: CNNM domain-containing protein [Thermoguttaceae bacterium]